MSEKPVKLGTAKQYLDTFPDERVEYLRNHDLPREEFSKLTSGEQTVYLNDRAKADGCYYDSGGIFPNSPSLELLLFTGIQAALESDPDEEDEDL
jgi:hypothetical protein